jgi:hypothetical protein
MNIYQILEALKTVEESAKSELDVMFNDWINSEDCPYNDMAGDDRAVMGCAYRYLDGKVDPSKIEDYAMALTHAFHGGVDEGFTGYWKGTDKRTPGTKMVGEDDLEEEWSKKYKDSINCSDPKGFSQQAHCDGKKKNEGYHANTIGAMAKAAYTPKVGDSVRTHNNAATGTVEKVEGNNGYFRSAEGKLYKTNVKNLSRGHAVKEAGANNPQQNTNNPIDAAKAAQQTQNTQTNLSKLTSAGVKLPVGISQAAQSAGEIADNPGAVQGQGMDMTDKKTATALGQEMAQAVAHGTPSQVSTIAAALKQIQQGTK